MIFIEGVYGCMGSIVCAQMCIPRAAACHPHTHHTQPRDRQSEPITHAQPCQIVTWTVGVSHYLSTTIEPYTKH